MSLSPVACGCRMIKLDRWVGGYSAILSHPLLLALRLYFGLTFVSAGYGKLSNIAAATQSFEQMGIIMPEANVYAAGLTEIIFGATLAIGLFSRLSSIPLIFVMIIAYLTAHWPNVFVQQIVLSDTDQPPTLISLFDFNSQFSYIKMLKDFVAASPFNHLLASLIVLAFGPGYLSVDQAFFGRLKEEWAKKKKKSKD